MRIAIALVVASILLVTATAVVLGQQQSQPTIQYKVIMVSPFLTVEGDIQNALNKQGQEGWDLVGFQALGSNRVLFVFKK